MWAGNSRSLENYAIYLFGPFIGSILTAIVFEFFYKPVAVELDPSEHDTLTLTS
jgi:hypothetical protein